MIQLLIHLFLLLPAPAARPTVTLTWDYDFTGTVICGTVEKKCLRHFEVGTLNGDIFATIKSIALIPGSSGKVTGITASFPLSDTAGQPAVAVIMVAHDPLGHRITSDPMKCSVPIP